MGAGDGPGHRGRRGFDPRDFDLGHKLRLVDGEHDLFGDGTVVCLPTYGHTPGHQSLKLRLPAANRAGRRRLLFLPHPARAALAANTSTTGGDARLARPPRPLEAAGARIFFGHDPDFWKTVPQAPRQLSKLA